MRIAFMGTPDFAVPSLAELIAAGHEIVAVYSQPPRPRGRGQKLTPSPVHAFADSMGLPVFTPESMKATDAIETFRSLDLDAAAVVAYGQILRTDVLEALQPATQRAVLDFLCGHEPDLIAAAESLGVAPAELAAARDRIAS